MVPIVTHLRRPITLVSLFLAGAVFVIFGGAGGSSGAAVAAVDSVSVAAATRPTEHVSSMVEWGEQAPAGATEAPLQDPSPAPTGPVVGAYQMVVHDRWRIVVVSATGVSFQLPAGDWDDGEPALSPDGTRIAFVSNRDGRFHIYVMHVDGGAIQQLTTGDFTDRAPAWSVDGTIIAFTSDRDGKPGEVYLVSASGGEVRSLVQALAGRSP